MKKFFLFVSFIACCLMFIVWPQVSFARIVPECITNGKSGPCELCDFFLLIANIFDFIAYRLAPPVAGFLFVVAGFLFLTSGGSEDRVTKAKGIFINIVIGLLAIYASWLIVHTLIQVIGKDVENFHKDTWYKFECKQ